MIVHQMIWWTLRNAPFVPPIGDGRGLAGSFCLSMMNVGLPKTLLRAEGDTAHSDVCRDDTASADF